MDKFCDVIIDYDVHDVVGIIVRVPHIFTTVEVVESLDMIVAVVIVTRALSTTQHTESTDV